MATLKDVHRLTVDQFYAMEEKGILHPEARVELLDGVIIEMSPIGNRHAATVDKFTRDLVLGVGRRAIVRVQGPLWVNDNSLLEPDVLLLRERADFYISEAPRPEDVILLIEVADSTVGYDRYGKLPAYASAGIPEVWLAVVRENRRAIEVYTQPAAGAYTAMRTLAGDDILTPPGFPEIALRVGEMLGAYPQAAPPRSESAQSGGQRRPGADKAEEVS